MNILETPRSQETCMNEQGSCVYRAKLELEETCTSRNSAGNLFRGELDAYISRSIDSVVELELKCF